MVTKIRSARVKGGFMKSKMEREANEVPVLTPTKTSQNKTQNVASLTATSWRVKCRRKRKDRFLGLLKGAEPDTVLSFPAEVDGCIGATSAKMGEMKDKIQDSI